LYDMLEREEAGSDTRSQTVARLLTTFGVDTAQAQRVSKVARNLLQQLNLDTATEEVERLQRKLDWAAQLHEIGSQISHSDYHKHGAYILDNADALGFALPELHRLSLLVLGHRGKIRKLEVDFDDESFIKQLLSLRLAVILCHARRDPEYKLLRLSLQAKPARTFELHLPQEWAKRFPQSAHLLTEEVTAWQKTSWTFQVLP
jgi:exopolyphosphatase / guanosine-5'-triphosphate,3'-diphosphate pyrophosphatase